jgi:L-seryl-tRNA(Ser) seleniumtransferase
MSGDKLLGGPQAGIILGSAATIAKLRKNPFTRAMRVDKLTLAALESTLRLYLEPERARREIPFLAMVSAETDEIGARARTLALQLVSGGLGAEIVATNASVGGGAFPAAAIPSFAVALSGEAESAERRLRSGELAVIGRIEDGQLLLDLRSVLPRDDAALAAAILNALT